MEVGVPSRRAGQRETPAFMEIPLGHNLLVAQVLMVPHRKILAVAVAAVITAVVAGP